MINITYIKMTFKHIDLHIRHIDSSSFRDQISIDIEIWGGAIYRGGGEPWCEGILAFIIKEFHLVKAITLIVIITYYCDLFKSFPLRMSFHQFLTSYYKDISLAIII